MGTTLAVETASPLPQQLARLDSERLRFYRENLDFYHGQQWTEGRRRRDRRLTLNYARAVIEKTASYTMTGVSFVADPEDDSPEAVERARRTERAIREVYEANGLEHLDFDNEIDCSVLGDAAYKVWWDAAEERVRVSAPDVQGLYVWPCAGDHSRYWKVASMYTLSRAEAESTLGPLPARPQSWSAPAERTIVEAWTDETFELWLDGNLLEENANPYGFVPFVIYPNVREPKRFWGVSDLEAIKEPLRELNRAVSQLSTILELSGNPIAVLENVTEAQDIAVQPGAVWEIPEKARAYLLDLLQGGGATMHVEYANLVLKILHDLAEVPRSAFGDSHGLSGIAFQMELDPLIKKVARKRLIRGAAFRRRNEMILRLLEQHTGETFAPYRTRVIWPPALPQDRTRLVDEEARLVASGIHSRRTAATLLDVDDPDAEWQRWQEEQSQVSEGGVR
ncbi:MAG: phage portal protein [Chloroflexota bacterium]